MLEDFHLKDMDCTLNVPHFKTNARRFGIFSIQLYGYGTSTIYQSLK